MHANKKIVKPMYKKIKEYLEILIDQLGEGEFLPSENELSKQFNVSRITIRSATKELEIEGKVIKHKGKGTFIAGKNNPDLFKMERCTDRLLSWEEEMEEIGAAPESIITELEACIIPKELVERFNLSFERTFVLKRVKIINGIRFFLINYFNPEHIRGLTLDELSKESIYDILAKKYNYQVFKAEEIIEAKNPNELEKEMLLLKDDEVVFSLTRISYTKDNICLGIGKLLVNGKNYQYHSKIFRK